jgi:serine/threonine protein kinase
MAARQAASHGRSGRQPTGLVHRDVKLANMLMDARPGRPDHVYLSDFGLTKGALSSASQTETGPVQDLVDNTSGGLVVAVAPGVAPSLAAGN